MPAKAAQRTVHDFGTGGTYVDCEIENEAAFTTRVMFAATAAFVPTPRKTTALCVSATTGE